MTTRFAQLVLRDDRGSGSRTMSRRFIWILVALALSACQLVPVAQPATPNPTPTATATNAPTATGATGLTGQPFGQQTIDEAVAVLARSGVGTYEDASAPKPLVAPTEPVVPLKYTLDQVRAMALEANAGGGIEGADLDGYVDTPADLAPPSYILAGYVAAVQTDGAALARELIGERDWHQAPRVVFPQLVLALFTADITRDQMATANRGPAAPWAPAAVARSQPFAEMAVPAVAAAQASGPCSAVSNFISGTLKAVFDALKLGETSSTIGSIFVSIWNFAVSVLETVVTALVKQLTQPVIDAIRRVAAVVGTVSMIVSAIRPWTVSIKADPSATEKGIAGGRPPDTGKLVAKVDLGGLDEWPSWAQDCATVAGRPLPNLKPENSPIAWDPLIQTPPDLVGEDSHQDKLDADGEAELDFTTLVDDVQDPYQTYPGAISAHVSIERQSLKDLAEIGQTALFGELPSIVSGAIQAFLGPSIQKIVDSLGKLITVTASGPAVVLFHVQQTTPPPSQPTPTPSSTPDEFCNLYRAYLAWAAANQSEDITKAKAAEITKRFQDMRPVAPAELLGAVDVMIKVYGTYATAPVPYDIPLVGPDAARIPESLGAMNAYCGAKF